MPRLTPYSREQLAKCVLFQGRTLNSAAAEFKVSGKTARKWIRRYQAEGHAGMADRSSRPQRLRQPTSPALLAQVEQLRRQRFTGVHIAQQTGLSRATVSRILRCLGLHRLRNLEPAPPSNRYELPAPGDLLHLDIKMLGRFRAVAFRPDGRRRGCSPVPAGRTCTSPSTTTPSSPLPSSCPTIPPHSPWPSCAPPWPLTLNSASACAACSPTTATAIAPRPLPPLVTNSNCAIPSPDLTLRAPTAKPSASSRPLCASGPTLRLIPTLRSVMPTFRIGSITTTGTALMLA